MTSARQLSPRSAIFSSRFVGVFYTLAVTGGAYLLSFGFRFDFDPTQFPDRATIIPPGIALLLCHFFIQRRFRVYGISWKHFSLPDLRRVVRAHGFSSLCLAAAVLFFRAPGFPRSIVILELLLALLFETGGRVLIRQLLEGRSTEGTDIESAVEKQVLVIGAGDSGHLLMKTLLARRRFGMKPVAVLDDSERLIGTTVFGVPVIGPLRSLDTHLSSGVDIVIVAIPSLGAAKLAPIRNSCRMHGISLRQAVSFEEIAVQESETEAIAVEVVLDRAVESTPDPRVIEELRGKTVLVTGAGGSIGSELSRQLSTFAMGRLLLLDNSEYNIFMLDRRLGNGTTPKTILMADVRDRHRLNRIFEEFSPQIVFHAAAYKHLPLMEEHPHEAFQTNVIGTRNLLQSCATYGVDRITLISSDKAVNPTSVMGCTKRITELLLREYVTTPALGAKIRAASSVRFGNVLNSSGSVIPIFREQIRSGGPVTVSHPDAERYFMTVEEAVKLLLEASMLGERGETFMLEMGEPVKILDVARRMIALSERRDIDVVFTGLRAGEKLREEIVAPAELLTPTPLPKVFSVQNKDSSRGHVVDAIQHLEVTAQKLTNGETMAALWTVVG